MYRMVGVAKYLFLLLISALYGTVLFKNILAVQHNCLNAMDLGIYHQALVELSQHTNLNPFLTIRGLHIFNDHFDPILVLVSFWTKWTSHTVLGTLALDYIAIIFFAAIVVLGAKKASAHKLILITIILVLSRGLLEALAYPVHASFWSLPIWALIVWSLINDKKWIFLLSCFLLGMFKEIYPYMVLFLAISVYFVVPNNKKISFGLGAIAILFILVAQARPLFLGDVNNYSDRVWGQWWLSPVEFLFQKVSSFDYRGNIKVLAPLIALILGIHKMIDARFRKKFILINLFMLPLFCLQFLWGSFQFHYSFPFFAVYCSFFSFANVADKYTYNKKLFLFIGLVFIVSGISSYEKTLSFLLFNNTSQCLISDDKLKMTKQIVEEMSVRSTADSVFATNGIIPSLISPSMQLYPIPPHGLAPQQFDVIILERNKSGNSYPLAAADVERFMQRCSPFAHEVRMDNRFYFYALGKFPSECLLK